MQKMKPKLETIFCTFLDSGSSNKKDHCGTTKLQGSWIFLLLFSTRKLVNKDEMKYESI